MDMNVFGFVMAVLHFRDDRDASGDIMLTMMLRYAVVAALEAAIATNLLEDLLDLGRRQVRRLRHQEVHEDR